MNENTPSNDQSIAGLNSTTMTLETTQTPPTEIPPVPTAPVAEPCPSENVDRPNALLDTTLGVVEVLSESELAELQACEAVIEMGWQTFVEVGLALARIRAGRLYKVEFESFEAYCQVKWQYGRRYADYLISAAQLFTHLRTICSHDKPDYESQVRPMVGLLPEQAQLAWQYAVEKAAGQKITARLVKSAVQELGMGANPAPVNRSTRQTKAEQRRLINDAVGQLLMLLSQKATYEALTAKVEALHRLIQPLFTSPGSPQ